MTETSTRVKTALVLGGGGARGFAHLGVLEVFEAAGLQFDMVVGTSMGALVGGLYAARIPLSQIEQLTVDIPWKKLVGYFAPDFKSGGLIGGAGIVKALKMLLGNADISGFATSFAAVATDIETGEKVVFTTGSAVTAIRASISVPGTFAPVTCQGRVLVDGGVLEPVPVPTARELGATRIIAVNVLDYPDKRRMPDESAPARPADAPAPKRPEVAQAQWPKRMLALVRDLAISRRSEATQKRRGPRLIDVLWNTLRIVQYNLSLYQTVGAQIVIEPEMPGILPSEFWRGHECIAAGRKAAQASLQSVIRIMA